jgi:hypothetical protein
MSNVVKYFRTLWEADREATDRFFIQQEVEHLNLNLRSNN